MIKTNTLLKTKVPIAHICYRLKIQSSMLAFEQKRLHQLSNSSDGKYVFVFWRVADTFHPSKCYAWLWSVKSSFLCGLCLWQSNGIRHFETCLVWNICVCDEARQCHLLITIWTDWFAFTGAVSIFHLLYDVSQECACGTHKFCILLGGLSNIHITINFRHFIFGSNWAVFVI